MRILQLIARYRVTTLVLLTTIMLVLQVWR
jgi:hypothetical protein